MRRLTEKQAIAVLEPIWEAVCDTFSDKGFDQPSDCRFEIDPSAHDSCRHFAATRTDGKLMIVAPDLADMPLSTIEAILAHEAGHIVDFCCPGRFWFRSGKLQDIDPLPSKGRRKILAMWKGRDNDEVEYVGDAIAEFVMERRIGYVGHPGCLVQSFDDGIKRPRGLR